MHFPRHTRGNICGCAARSRHRVNIAKHIKGDSFAVRRDVEAHPCTAVDINVDIARITRRVHDVPFCFVFCRFGRVSISHG